MNDGVPGVPGWSLAGSGKVSVVEAANLQFVHAR
jgi:hypothetical protein